MRHRKPSLGATRSCVADMGALGEPLCAGDSHGRRVAAVSGGNQEAHAAVSFVDDRWVRWCKARAGAGVFDNGEPRAVPVTERARRWVRCCDLKKSDRARLG
jgi:hypothetical protein